ncbi:MAG: hypothetical protein U0359_06835 [Byssovorax sp.]
MLRRLRSSLLLSISALLLPACGGAGGGGGHVAAPVAVEQTIFPSKDALVKIAEKPVPAKLSDESTKDMPSWDLMGPLPSDIDNVPFSDDSPWGKLFASVVSTKGDQVVANEAMHCFARENAAFVAATDARPAEMLARFFAARCGVMSGPGATTLQVITADERMTDDAIFAKFEASTKAVIEKHLASRHLMAGLAYVRKGGRAVMALSLAPETARLDRTPIVPGPDGKVILRGEVLGPAIGLRALINRGRFGYAECAVSSTVALPRFLITCDASREDELAWISLSSRQPGRVLGHSVAELLVWPSGAPAKAYARLTAGATGASGSAPEALLQEINRIRGEARLSPIGMAEAETKTAAQLAPHYFGGAEGADKDVPDQVALGLLAGWEVEGTIRTGHFVSTWVPGTTVWSDVVRSAISRPIGRETLLDPGAEKIALGPVNNPQGSGALFTTYALFENHKHDEDVRALAQRIATARAERHLTPPAAVADLNALAGKAAAEVQAGRQTSSDALNGLLRAVSDKLGQDTRGWAAEATSIEHLTIPDEIVTAPSLRFGVGIAHHRNEGEPWGRFVIFLVMIEEGAGAGVMHAGRGEPHAG